MLLLSGGCFYEMANAGGPFESFKNPYSTANSGTAAIKAVADTTSHADDGTVDCTTLLAGAVNGDVIVQVSGAGAAHIEVWFCSKVGDNDGKLTKKDSTISNW